MIIPEDEYDNYLSHYGIQRKSGRYPWGSGGKWGSAGDELAVNRASSFFQAVAELEAQGLSKVDIAKGLGMNSTEMRQVTTIARNAERTANQEKAEKLREKGWSTSAIGREMGRNESYIRSLLDPSTKERAARLNQTVDVLRAEVDKGGYLDVGKGVSNNLSMSREQLSSALAVLKDEGYVVLNDVRVPQAGTKQLTTLKLLAPPGTTKRDVVLNMDDIKGLTPVVKDGVLTDFGLVKPLQIKQDRIAINYAEDGGAKADGVIYVRPGVKDIDIGGKAYAQVRIDVEGTHYLKGMAMYKDDLPKGVDLQFNTNKKRADIGTDKLAAMKKQSDDKDNPFGAQIRRQILETGPDGQKRTTSAMNLINEEGSWDKWSRNLSSQVLSKQSPKLAQQQLDKTFQKKRDQLDEIMALTNPTVKAKLLQTFSDEADSSAVHLSAAGLPRSSYHVILPFNSLKDTEVYAPNFNNGERVALIRYPHGGRFEIPELTVNNNHPEAKSAIGRAVDAVGINHKVAERMSGADFDGDFVMVIPNNTGAIKSEPALKRLQGFDPQKYKLPDDAPRMKAKTKGKQMGDVSNLITDMTIRKASNDEIARAVAHSMVVIDAEKHHLNYKQSAIDHGIAALKVKYQGTHESTGQPRGAATLISRATSQTQVLDSKARRAADGGPIDKATGKKMFTPTGDYYDSERVMKRTGEVRTTRIFKMRNSVQLAEVDDAFDLSSGTPMESVYATHSNKLKALANESRKEMVSLKPNPYSPSAKKAYDVEVKEMNAMLDIALRNAPRERRAQLLTNTVVKQKQAAKPGMDDAELKKVRAQTLATMRARTGADKDKVDLNERHWAAIQAGAITSHKLREILDNGDIEQIKTLATPKVQLKMNTANLAQAKRMAARGATQAEIAGALGVSLTTLKKGLADG